MNMFTSSELAGKTRMVCDTAREQGCAVITTNGKADLAMIDLSAFDTINDFVHAYDTWRMRSALQKIRNRTANRPISLEEIDSEIAAVRNR